MEQSKGGMDSTEKLLRAAHKEIPGGVGEGFGAGRTSATHPYPRISIEYVFEAKTPELKALKEKSDALKVSRCRTIRRSDVVLMLN